jgi:2-(1,2-epoxy-1,2-dihydrophenyl)acetyl-CoA isomerase
MENAMTDAARVVVEDLYAALPTGDRSAIRALLADDFVGRVTPGLPFGIGGVHAGPDAMIDEVWFAIGARWRVRAVPGRWSVLGDGRVLVEGTYRGRGRRSGTAVDACFTHLWEVRDGRLAGITQTTDSAAFLAALDPTERPMETLSLAVDDGVATLRMSRPEVRNAIDQRVADELLEAAIRIAGDPTVRVLLVVGDGPDLTVGGDIAYFTEHSDDDLGALLRRMTTPFHLAFQVLAHLDAPIVTVAHGAVAGGGLGLVYAADVVVAAEDARFVTAFGALGLSGDGGGTWHLPRRIGPARAAWAYLANEPIDAPTALELGLVTEVVPALDARERGEAVARRLAAGPTRAFAQMRGLLRDSWGRSLPDQLHAETAALVATGRTADARRGIDAFLTKQRPTFEGA